MARPGKKADRLAESNLLPEPEGITRIPLPRRRPGESRSRNNSVADCGIGIRLTDADSPEADYLQSVSVGHRKRWGQFFTPQVIADLMCDWVLEMQPETVLDPAVGPGIFVRTIRDRNVPCRLTAIDKDPVAMAAFRQATHHLENLTIVCDDFLLWESSSRFDAVIANPPYLRHHDLNYDEDIFSVIGSRNGVQLSRLTNLYGLFILEICRRLRPGGRGAIIVPGEWLNANFGTPLKQLLLEQRLLRHLVYFSHAETIFADALTTACLLFIEKPQPTSEDDGSTRRVQSVFQGVSKNVSPSGTLHTIFVHSADDLAPIQRALQSGSSCSTQLTSRQISHSVLLDHPKWNALLQHGPESIPDGFVTLSELATTRRGIATGANPFFHVSRWFMEQSKLPLGVGSPCVGRAADVDGYLFSPRHFQQLEEASRRTRLLCFGETLTSAEAEYLQKGERAGLPRRYLLAVRKPWYRMENRPASPIWAAVFGRKELRFIWNQAGVQNLTTFHCVYPQQLSTERIPALVACLNSPLVQQLARQQQRVYGGGLLKFEPRDLLQIPVPDLRLVGAKVVHDLAELLGQLNEARRHPSDLAGLLPQLDFAVGAAASEASAKLAELAEPNSPHPSSSPS